MDIFTKPVPADKTAIAGRVGDSQDRSLASATVLIVDGPPHRDLAALTDSQGRYRFDSLIPGNYTLLVNASGHPQKQGQVAAQAGALARLDFTMQ
jgi:Carboxypeptidase regulatory-like domain